LFILPYVWVYLVVSFPQVFIPKLWMHFSFMRATCPYVILLDLFILIILSRFRGDYRRGLDWWMDLLTTYTHDSELQAITATPIIPTVHKSPQHTRSLFQPAVSSPAIPWQWLLTASHRELNYRLTSSLAYSISARDT
jgi:hypothetical protein